MWENEAMKIIDLLDRLLENESGNICFGEVEGG